MESLIDSQFYKAFLFIGALLGFTSTFLAIRKEVIKGPKIVAKITSSTFAEDGTRVTAVVDGKQTTQYTTIFRVRVQLQNSGTDLTSIVGGSLDISGKMHDASVLHHGKVSTQSGKLLSGFSTREKDERTIVLAPGAAIVEPFQFEVGSVSPFSDPTEETVVVSFVNHKSLALKAIFEKQV